MTENQWENSPPCENVHCNHIVKNVSLFLWPHFSFNFCQILSISLLGICENATFSQLTKTTTPLIVVNMWRDSSILRKAKKSTFLQPCLRKYRLRSPTRSIAEFGLRQPWLIWKFFLLFPRFKSGKFKLCQELSLKHDTEPQNIQVKHNSDIRNAFLM